MTTRNDDTSPGLQNPTIRAIAASERRAVLEVILSTDRLPVPALTDRLTDSTDESASEPTGRGVRTGLTHVHLPRLEAAGLVTWDRDADAVERTSHPAFEDPRFERVLAIEADDLDAVLDSLSHEYRRIGLSVLRDAGKPLSRTALVEAILRRRGEPADSTAVDAVAAPLYHSHVPVLSDRRLLTRDAETGTVAYADHPTLETVFDVIYGPSDRFVDKLDQFLDHLNDSYPTGNRGEIHTGWPHFWSHPQHG